MYSGPCGIVNSLAGIAARCLVWLEAKVLLVLEAMGFLSEHATIALQQILLAKMPENERFHNRK